MDDSQKDLTKAAWSVGSHNESRGHDGASGAAPPALSGSLALPATAEAQTPATSGAGSSRWRRYEPADSTLEMGSRKYSMGVPCPTRSSVSERTATRLTWFSLSQQVGRKRGS